MSEEEATSTDTTNGTVEPEATKPPTTNGASSTSQEHISSSAPDPPQPSNVPPAVTTSIDTTHTVDSSTAEPPKTENGQQESSTTEAPPALVNCTTKDSEAEKNEELSTTTAELPMETNEEEGVASRSDREDSPELVIVMQPDTSEEEAPMISDNHNEESKDDSDISGEEIDLNVPLEESSDEDQTPVNILNQTSRIKYGAQNPVPQTNGTTPPPSRTAQEREVVRSVSPSFRAKQVAKLKRFFTTLQGFGNNLGSEGAEQVQELITALLNKTASIEEFHQEIQVVTNHPLKQFIIPFLQENLDYLREELKQSSKTLSDILVKDGEGPSQNSFALTPQPTDDELPVYKTPQSSTVSKSGLGVISSRKIQAPSTSAEWRNGTRTTRVTSQVVSGGVLVVASTHQSAKVYGTATGVGSRSTVRVVSHSPTVSGTRMSPAVADEQAGLIRSGTARKRDREGVTERVQMSFSQEKDTQTVTSSKQYTSHVPKRPRTDHTSYTDDVVITTNPARHNPPPYPQPPLTYPIPSTTPTTAEGTTPTRHSIGSLAEDWKHLDMMLTSMQGMMERTRHAVALLKERITYTQTELERREMDQEGVVQARVSEVVDKVKQRAEDEKQVLLTETRKQIHDAVTSVRSELEARVSSASNAAVQEALKEAHKQSNSKENCWNCGRRATETCSGCNKARYCGTFCQHKDWSNHMHHCASGIQGGAQNSSGETTAAAAVYDRRRHAGDVTMMSSGNRGKPVSRGVPIPVNLVQGGELSMRHIPRPLSHGHTDIIPVAVKTEKT